MSEVRGQRVGGAAEAGCGRLGFTLLELLIVMGIMALLMGMSVTGFINMRRGAEIRGAASMVQSTLMLARQQAVTKRRTVEVHFRQSLNIETNWIEVKEIATGGVEVPVHGDVVLSPGVYFSPLPDKITFKPTGKAGDVGAGISQITITERVQAPAIPQKKKIEVWHLTGASRVE